MTLVCGLMDKTLDLLISETDEKSNQLLLLQLRQENRHQHQSFHSTKLSIQEEKQNYNKAHTELEATKAIFTKLSEELALLRQQHRSYLDQIDRSNVNVEDFEDVKAYFEGIITERQDLIAQNAHLKTQINELVSKREKIINDIKQFEANINEWLESGKTLLS